MKATAVLTLKRSIAIVLLFFLLIMFIHVSKYEISIRSSPTRCGVGNRAVTFQYLTQVAKSCERTANRTSVLIGVVSSADNFESRAAIRDTWGGTALKMGFIVVFLLGLTPDQKVQGKVLAEHETYGDVVQGDFVDSYENLTYKTAMIIRWAREKCSETEFVLKIDDDMLLGVWDLAVVVNSLVGIKHSMWGYLYRNARPHRNVASKWYVSKEAYASDAYPDFLSGTAYLISGDAISALDDVTHDECFFPLEDIYLTAIVAERAQLSLVAM
ncbi:beta-1,3-galactosyltransferase 5-like [Rhipicephalus sanguineus]|uniref:beta-1,3-galactosyltransferase 5-like n=1 Tax=Rhipicephalus sanguineus TaxID=34632 RepID=UPI001893E87F|nr:beta-1,3-galactosyltransferase 5-like [Rhipicephalus sanguineus]